VRESDCESDVETREKEGENTKKKSYKKSYPKSGKSENVFFEKTLRHFKRKKLYEVEGMNGKQVFTRLSMFDCGLQW
jgi:hypothetical protein